MFLLHHINNSLTLFNRTWFVVALFTICEVFVFVLNEDRMLCFLRQLKVAKRVNDVIRFDRSKDYREVVLSLQ